MGNGKKGGSGSLLTWLVVLCGGFLAYEYLANKGGQYDYISKVMSGRARSRYVRGGVEWGDRYYYDDYQ
jgi:hypothetical protein